MSIKSFPTTFQQSIKSTSKYVCTNTLSTIYKCNSHANALTLKINSKEQLSPSLISIYYKISLTKINRKIIEDIPWIITFFFFDRKQQRNILIELRSTKEG